MEKANIPARRARIRLSAKKGGFHIEKSRFFGLKISQLRDTHRQVHARAQVMGLFDTLFRRPQPIRDLTQLANFIDEQAAFLVQKGIYEYSRARAGHYAKVLFAEESFQASVEQSRWRAFPLGLAMVGEVVEGVLRPHVANDRRAVLDELIDLVLGIFDRYPVPPSVGKDPWLDARSDLAGRLDRVGTHAVKRVMDVPGPLADQYFAMMPIHEKLRAPDRPTLHNYLRVTLCNIHDELIKRMDAVALVAQLRGSGTAAPA
jgi:hypothetical protein